MYFSSFQAHDNYIVINNTIEFFLVFLIENRKHWHLFKTKIFNASKPVRVTVAYLFRIEVNGKYILIKRHKKDRVGFQPIGGAFKYFKEENDYFKNFDVIENEK